MEATDDTGDTVTYAITGGADMAQFHIDETSGELTFQTAPDHENPADVASTTPANAAGNNEYVVTVTATGGADARALSTEQTITVTVTDVDETPTVALVAVTSTPECGCRHLRPGRDHRGHGDLRPGGDGDRHAAYPTARRRRRRG